MRHASRLVVFKFSLPFAALLLLLPAALSAQTVSYAGSTSAVNFGNVNLCRNPSTNPGPCSETLTLPYKITESGTLGTPKVMTQGIPNLDFTLVSSTCEGNVITGDTCEVKVKFAPKYPGSRPGGVLITDSLGKVVAKTLLYGTADGPQVGFLPGTHSFLPNLFVDDVPLTADSIGDIYTIGGELLVGADSLVGIPQNDVGFGFIDGQVSIDGAGDTFYPGYTYPGYYDYGVFELSVGSQSYSFLPFTAFPIGITANAVDIYGDVYAAPWGSSIYELTPSGQQNTFTSADLGFINVTPIAVDAAKNIFIGGGGVVKISPNGAASVILPFSCTYPCPFEQGVAVDNVGNVYAPGTYTQTNEILELPVGGGAPIVVANVGDDTAGYPTVDADGNLYINLQSGPSQGRVVKVERAKLSTLNFGSVAVGSSATLPITVLNTGNRPLTISPFFVSPSYSIVGTAPENCTSSIAPANTCTLQIQFAPMKTGAHTIQFTLSTNAVVDTVTTLEGTGTN